MSDERPTFEPLPEDWERALCVVAHPDDLEFGAAAAVARWTGQGKEVVYCMVTSGEAGIDGLHPDECRTVREAEQVESARVVGVDEVEFLGLARRHPGVRRRAAPRARRGHPAAPPGRRHHRQLPRHLGRAQPQPGRPHRGRPRRAGRGARRRQPVDLPRAARRATSSRGAGSRAVWAFGSPEARHGVDTTDTFDAGVASLEAHRAYIDGLGWENWDPREFLEGMARQTGQRPWASRSRRRSRSTPWAGATEAQDTTTPSRTAKGPTSMTSGPSSGSPDWTRTNNPPVNSRMLCQLSYRGSLVQRRKH